MHIALLTKYECWILVFTRPPIFHAHSSFDEFAAEVRSGELKWSAVHKSDSFWRDHVMKLNENDHEVWWAGGHLFLSCALVGLGM